jgi:hypothetical protein
LDGRPKLLLYIYPKKKKKKSSLLSGHILPDFGGGIAKTTVEVRQNHYLRGILEEKKNQK